MDDDLANLEFMAELLRSRDYGHCPRWREDRVGAATGESCSARMLVVIWLLPGPVVQAVSTGESQRGTEPATFLVTGHNLVSGHGVWRRAPTTFWPTVSPQSPPEPRRGRDSPAGLEPQRVDALLRCLGSDAPGAVRCHGACSRGEQADLFYDSAVVWPIDNDPGRSTIDCCRVRRFPEEVLPLLQLRRWATCRTAAAAHGHELGRVHIETAGGAAG